MDWTQLAGDHQAALTASLMALVHFSHLAWRRLFRLYGYAAFNGGVYGVARTFLFGRCLRHGNRGTELPTAVPAKTQPSAAD